MKKYLKFKDNHVRGSMKRRTNCKSQYNFDQTHISTLHGISFAAKKRQIVAITKNKSYPKPLFLQSKVGFLQKISYQYHTAREREFVSFHIFLRQWDAVECKHDFPLEINCLDNYSTILTSIHCNTNSKNLAKVSFRAWKSVYILLLPLIYLRLLGLCSIW